MQQPGATEAQAVLTTAAAVTQITKDISIVGLLILIIVGGKLKWWVFGWVYEAEQRRCKDYEAMLFEVIGLSNRTVDVLKERTSADLPWRRDRT